MAKLGVVRLWRAKNPSPENRVAGLAGNATFCDDAGSHVTRVRRVRELHMASAAACTRNTKLEQLLSETRLSPCRTSSRKMAGLQLACKSRADSRRYITADLVYAKPPSKRWLPSPSPSPAVVLAPVRVARPLVRLGRPRHPLSFFFLSQCILFLPGAATVCCRSAKAIYKPWRPTKKLSTKHLRSPDDLPLLLMTTQCTTTSPSSLPAVFDNPLHRTRTLELPLIMCTSAIRTSHHYSVSRA